MPRSNRPAHSNNASHVETLKPESYYFDTHPDSGAHHAETSHSDLPASTAHDYYTKAAKTESHGGSHGKSHGGGRIASVVFAQNGSYGDTSGFVNLVQDDHNELGIYDARISTYLGRGKLTGQHFSLGPVSEVGLTARTDYSHGSMRYAAGPGVDLYNGAIRVSALYRDDMAQPGATGQVSATWNVPFHISGQKGIFAGYADAVGSEGDAARHAVVKNELWIKAGSVYIGGHVKAQINKYGAEGDHDIQAAAGIKIPLLKF